MDMDIKADPEPAGFYETLPKLKESLQINIELASPDLFVPPCRAGRTALDSSPDTEWSIFITTTFMDKLWLKSNGITPVFWFSVNWKKRAFELRSGRVGFVV